MTTFGSLGEFLRSRRARLDPDAVGLPPSPVLRRGRGLRREEVAALAGVSVAYYARLEQGRIGNVSDQVLSAIENALQLDPVEQEHLRSLVAAVPARPRRSVPAARAGARATLRAFLEAIDPVPAMLQGPCMDVLAWNRAAAVLLTDFAAMPVAERNIVRWLFLDPTTRERYPDWEGIAAPTVAALRTHHDPRRPDAALERLVGELSVVSADFARYWADYRLFKHTHGRKRIFHPTVGGDDPQLRDAPCSGLRRSVRLHLHRRRRIPSEEKLQILMSWGRGPAEQEHLTGGSSEPAPGESAGPGDRNGRGRPRRSDRP